MEEAIIDKKGKNESAPLMTRHRHHCKNICPKSKAALIILLWNALVSLTYNFIVEPGILLKLRASGYYDFLNFYGVLAPFGTTALLLALFYPLSGLLGDVKCGRFKMIKRSLFLMMFMPFLFAAFGSSFLLPSTVHEINIIIMLVNGLATLLTLTGFVMYLANVLPFAMDQLRDLPSRDSLLFINWFIWAYYVSMLTSQLMWDVIIYHGAKSSSIPGVVLLILTSISVTILLLASLCIAYCRQRWFNIEPRSINPYRLVYKVIKFACKHKIPVNRSAFTYCEDTKPSRLDLGKSKYGGPFTNEQVEDVKVCAGVIKILFCFGPVFAMDFAANSLFPLFSSHLEAQYFINESSFRNLSSLQFVNAFFLQNELLSSLVVVIFSPFCFYSCIPLILRNHRALGVLRRMEMAMIASLINLVFLLAVDIAAHATNEQLGCMLDFSALSSGTFTPLQSTLLFIMQQILSAISSFMINVSCLEFICAQSPHSMKGMLIGLLYTIKGLFQLAGAVTVIPFHYWEIAYVSCGFGYYGANVLLGVTTFLLFVCAAKRYKYRERDEIPREREYAENYYSKTPQEMHNSYS